MKAVVWLILTLVVLAAHAADAPAPTHFDSRFVQTRRLHGFDAPITSKGIMRFDKTQGFHWEITSPYHYEFEMNGGGARETLPDGTVRRLDASQTPWLSAVQHIIVGALSGDRSELKRYFTIVVTPQAKGDRVVLTPKPSAMSDAIIRITVTESAPGSPREIAIQEASGDQMTIRFTSSAP